MTTSSPPWQQLPTERSMSSSLTPPPGACSARTAPASLWDEASSCPGQGQPMQGLRRVRASADRPGTGPSSDGCVSVLIQAHPRTGRTRGGSGRDRCYASGRLRVNPLQPRAPGGRARRRPQLSPVLEPSLIEEWTRTLSAWPASLSCCSAIRRVSSIDAEQSTSARPSRRRENGEPTWD